MTWCLLIGKLKWSRKDPKSEYELRFDQYGTNDALDSSRRRSDFSSHLSNRQGRGLVGVTFLCPAVFLMRAPTTFAFLDPVSPGSARTSSLTHGSMLEFF